MDKKLCKSRTNIKIDGVCAGIAKYLGIDVTIVRLIWVIVALFGGSGLIAYIACAIIMPREPEAADCDGGEYDRREN